ncbi:MAG: hypothetical protein JRD04_00970 [Deltaproteobacteria bacterium]|nr:hypothetical protein [Deltaproteobacteria bacterium]
MIELTAQKRQIAGRLIDAMGSLIKGRAQLMERLQKDPDQKVEVTPLIQALLHAEVKILDALTKIDPKRDWQTMRAEKIESVERFLEGIPGEKNTDGTNPS